MKEKQVAKDHIVFIADNLVERDYKYSPSCIDNLDEVKTVSVYEGLEPKLEKYIGHARIRQEGNKVLANIIITRSQNFGSGKYYKIKMFPGISGNIVAQNPETKMIESISVSCILLNFFPTQDPRLEPIEVELWDV